MTAKIIAVANMKGGVGKTTMTIAMSEAFAADGFSVLVIDLDAQASASVSLAGDNKLTELVKQKRTVDALLENQLLGAKNLRLTDCIRSNISNVTYQNDQLPISLLASSPQLRDLEFKVIHTLTESGHGWDKIVTLLFVTIDKQLIEARKQYDYVFIDCAPGISIMTEAAIRLSDLVIVPTISDFLSTYGLQSFCATIWQRGMSRRTALRPKQLPYVLVTRFKKVKAHADTLEKLKNEGSAKSPRFRLFDTVIPEASSVGIVEPKDVVKYLKKWGSKMPTNMDGLTKEIRKALNG